MGAVLLLNKKDACVPFAVSVKGISFIRKIILDGFINGHVSTCWVDDPSYDRAVRLQYLKTDQDYRKSPGYIQIFSSGDNHWNIADGEIDAPADLVEFGNSLDTEWAGAYWVFCGNSARFPGAVFSCAENALDWARSRGVRGSLVKYPADEVCPCGIETIDI